MSRQLAPVSSPAAGATEVVEGEFGLATGAVEPPRTVSVSVAATPATALLGGAVDRGWGAFARLDAAAPLAALRPTPRSVPLVPGTFLPGSGFSARVPGGDAAASARAVGLLRDPLAPPNAPNAPGAAGSGSSGGIFLFSLLALLAALWGLAALRFGRLTAVPARLRPVAFIALLERPG